MAVVQTEQAVGSTPQKKCITKTNLPCVLLAAGVPVVGAALGTALYVGLAKSSTKSSNTKPQELTVHQEDPYSIGCYADDQSLRIMPYVYINDALTPLVSIATFYAAVGTRCDDT